MEDSLCFYFLNPTDTSRPFASDTSWRKKWLNLRLMQLHALQSQINSNIDKQDARPPASQDDYACCSRFRTPPNKARPTVSCQAMGAFVPDSNTILRARHDPRAPSAHSDSDDLITQPPAASPFADLTQLARGFQETDNSDGDAMEPTDLFSSFDAVSFINPNRTAPEVAAPAATSKSDDIEIPAWSRVSRPPLSDIESTFNNFSAYREVHLRCEKAEAAARAGFGGELAEDVVSEPLGSALVVTIDVSGDEDDGEFVSSAMDAKMAAWPLRSYDRLGK